jgi:hypothetical protein
MSGLIQTALRRGSDCPELTHFFEALEAASQTPARVQAEQHLSGCPGCQTEWSLYRQFEAAEMRPDERPAVDYIVKQVQSKRAAQRREDRAADRRSSWQRFLTPAITPAWLGGAAIAMAALIVAIGIGSQWRTRHTAPEVYTDNQILRSQLIELTTPLTELTRPPSEIHWKSLPGVTQYTVSITEVDQTRIVYKNITSSSLILPDNARKLLLSARTLLLSVTASDAAGREVGRSQIAKIRVSPSR